jgi:HEAT repeat protein
MVALGDAAVDPLCLRLSDPRSDVRRVAAHALGLMASPRATACLTAGAASPDATTRATAASALKILLSFGQLDANTGWPLVQTLLRDPDPAVRVEALHVLRFFTAGVSLPAATAAQQDADATVRAEADAAAKEVEAMRRLRFGR